MRPRISAAELEARRMKAVRLSEEGMASAVIARKLGTSCRSVNRWIASRRRYGIEGLVARRASGRPPRLTQAERKRLIELLALGYQGSGGWSYSWNVFDVADLIQETFNVEYHPHSIERVLETSFASIGMSSVSPLSDLSRPAVRENLLRHIRPSRAFPWGNNPNRS